MGCNPKDSLGRKKVDGVVVRMNMLNGVGLYPPSVTLGFCKHSIESARPIPNATTE